MADNEDKWVFEWVDRLDSAELQGLSITETSEIDSLNNEAWLRIKKRTFFQLGFPEDSLEEQAILPTQAVIEQTSRFAPKRWLIAACAAFVLCAAIILSSANVRAELKKVLQFIPGFGYVEQSDETVQIAYVMQKPIEAEGEYGTIKVDGVLIQGDKAQIGLSGDRTSAIAIETLKVTTEQGQYVFKKSHASWGLGGPWEAGYYYEGSIPPIGLDKAMIQFGDTIIGPLHLTKAQSADDLLGLGPSDLQNGIRITGVITHLDGKQRKVNLLTQLPDKQIADSFGKEPISEGQQLQLVNSYNQPMEIMKDVGFLKPLEFIFEDPTKGSEHYQLTIPSIRILDRGVSHQKVTIPVPSQGSEDIHQTIQVNGLPLDFTRVERIDEKTIHLSVDTHYDATQPKTLQSYRLFTKEGMSFSYGSQSNESSKAIIMEFLTVEPGQRKLTFYVGDPQIVIKGPWILRGLQ